MIEADQHIALHHDSDDIKEIFAEEYLAFNRGIIAEAVKAKPKIQQLKTTTEKIDSVLIHPVFGIPIFLFFMWGLFQLTFEDRLYSDGLDRCIFRLARSDCGFDDRE